MNNNTHNTNHSPEYQAPRMLIEREAVLRRADVIIDLAADNMPADTYRSALQHTPASQAVVSAAVERMMDRTTFVEEPRTVVNQPSVANTAPFAPETAPQVTGDVPQANKTVPSYQLPADGELDVEAMRKQVEDALL